ncbi:hypothetical protein P280DRAFT_290657 [Massarina eburnea CBS 473.64]|uniref:ribonuclease Z n=1 Tax=Massarina eburnea CBS 473.64 TaxID=1395130 RepID=A0A6A6S3Z6_9PLEO|nr:hypothetical protein P280DRAFT_290657 [Massarina eburnea CBS 473.64]
MSSSIQVITVPTADTPGTTFVINTQRQHYVFGSHAEGTQRAMTQMGSRLMKVRDFFMTGKVEWANAGGLVGLALTLADSASSSYETHMSTWNSGQNGQKGAKRTPKPQAPSLNVYGPPNLKHMLATCRRFIFRKGLPITATEYSDVPPERDEDGHILPTWQDSNIQVWALSVAPAQTGSVEGDQNQAERQAYYDRNSNKFEELQAPEMETPREREARHDRIRTAVLGYMFNSNWSFDTLVERHISEVEVPAAIFVRNPHTHAIEPYRGPMPGGAVPLPDIRVLTRTPWPGAKVNALPPTKPAPESLSYIVRSQKARGTMDVERATELLGKPGPLFGRLSNGHSVVNNKGETITPDMVMGPDKLGHGVAILDVPSITYLESLIQREELQSETIMNGIKAFFWVLGPGLAGHATLQQFTQKMDKVQHIISSVDTCVNGIAFDSVAAQTARLGNVDPARYNLPNSDNETLPQTSLSGRASSGEGGLPPNTTAAGRGMAFTLMPRWEERAGVIPYPNNVANTIKEQMDPEVLENAKQAQEAIQSDTEALQAWRKLIARPDSEVITLGTGSALPSKYRNVSATLLRVPGVGNYLFDCGENTLGQLQRVFTTEEVVDVIKNLRMIWISHLHADHHLGTASVIKAWYKLKHDSVPIHERPQMSSITSTVPDYGLSVVSHDGMIKWLWEYSSVEDFGYSRILPFEIKSVEKDADTGSRLTLSWGARGANADEYLLKQQDYETIFGLSDIQSCLVRHCHGSMAVSLTFPHSPDNVEDIKPLKVSYSGDCRPSRNFTRIGRNTTVLIHEATFDDELRGDALAKKHSTTSEALSIGAQMDAKAVVLTHFSQRYQKIPVLESTKDGDQKDDLSDFEPMEDVQEEGEMEEDDGPADNMDAHSSAKTAIAPPASATAFSSASKPAEPAFNSKASGSHEKVIRVQSKDMKVGVAFDYMRVKIGEIAQLEKFNDALNKLLVKEEEEEGEGVEEVEEVEVVEVNKNGKKTSGDEGGGKKKKSKRNN